MILVPKLLFSNLHKYRPRPLNRDFRGAFIVEIAKPFERLSNPLYVVDSHADQLRSPADQRPQFNALPRLRVYVVFSHSLAR